MVKANGKQEMQSWKITSATDKNRIVRFRGYFFVCLFGFGLKSLPNIHSSSGRKPQSYWLEVPQKKLQGLQNKFRVKGREILKVMSHRSRKTQNLSVNSAHILQFSSVAQLCPSLCDPMNCSMPGLPVHQQLLEFTQTHVHRVGDAIQPSHPLSSPSPPALNPSQHQGLFQWVNSSHEVSKVLEFQLQHHSFPMNTQDWSALGWTGWTSLQSKGLSTVFSNTTVQKHQFFSAQLSSQSNSRIHTWPLEKP